MQGVAIIVGIAAKDLVGPHHLPTVHVVLMLSLATIGLCVTFLHLLFRRLICLELIAEDKPNEKHYRDFGCSYSVFQIPAIRSNAWRSDLSGVLK